MKRSFGFAQDDIEGGFVKNGGLDERAIALASSAGASPALLRASPSRRTAPLTIPKEDYA